MRYRRWESNLGPIGFLIIANILLYIATSIYPRFINLFGLQPATFLERPWSLLTNLFVHAPFPTISHILTNMITLYFFGSYLRELISTRNFFIVYFLGGIVGNILYILLGSSYSIAVGASGALFAVGGALTVMRPRVRVFVFPIPLPLPLWVAVIGGFLIISFFPYVAWQAHLGGLLCGLVAGYFFRRKALYF